MISNRFSKWADLEIERERILANETQLAETGEHDTFRGQ